MKLTILFFVVVLSFSLSTNAVGICETDEICGYTDLNVYFPALQTEHTIATTLTINEFHAISDNGFNLGTVGGINFYSDDHVLISTPGGLNMGALVGGDVEFQADHLGLESGNELNIRVLNEAILDTKDDIIFDVPSGLLQFSSHFETNILSVNGMILSSSIGEFRIEAERGSVTMHGDTVGFASGGDGYTSGETGFEFRSSDKFLINADREFNLLSNSLVELSAFTTLTIDSKINNIEFEAGDLIDVQAKSNIVSSAADDIILESLLANILLKSDDTISFYARNFHSKAENINLSSTEAFIVEGSGHANFFSKGDNVLTIPSALIVAIDNLNFIGTSDGDIVFDVNELKQTSSNLIIETADLTGSRIEYAAGTLDFISKNSDIHFESTSSHFSVGGRTTFNVGDFVLAGSFGHYSAGPLEDETGLFSLTTGTTTSMDADGNIIFLSDNSMEFNADSIITFDIGGSMQVDSSFRTSFLSDRITFTASDFVRITSGASAEFITEDMSVTGTNSNEIYSQYEMQFSIEDVIELNGNDVAIETNIGEFFVRAGDIEFEAVDVVELDANDHDDQFTDVLVFGDMDITGGQSLFEANIFTVEAPSGPLILSAEDEIEFKSYDSFFNAISDSINFRDGVTDINADNIFFRSGNEFDYTNDDNSLTLSSINADVISASGISLFADTLSVNAGDSILFTGDFSVSFISNTDLDLSPKDDGIFTIEGGRVDLVSVGSDINISGDHMAKISSDDYNNIEFASQDLDLDSMDNLEFNAQHFNLRAEGETLFTTNNDLSIITNDGNIVFETDGYSPPFTGFDTDFNVAGDSSFTGDYFLAHSFSKDGNWQLYGNPINVNGTDSIIYDGEGTFDFESVNGDIIITGGDMTIEFLLNNQETPSTFVVDGDFDYITCDGDIRFDTVEFTHTSPSLLVSQIVDPCGTCVDCTAGDFTIITHSELTQTINSMSQTFTASNSFDFFGGRVDYHANDTLTINSGSSIIINSINDDSILADSFDDKVFAASQVLIDSTSQTTYTSVGYSGLPDTPVILNGFEVDVHTGVLDFNIPTASFEAYALRDTISFVAGNGETKSTIEIFIQNTRDLFVSSTDGNIVLEAFDLIDNGIATASAAIEFNAVEGDLSIDAVQAYLVFTSSQNQMTETESGKITFTAGDSISHMSTDHDGQLLYNPLTDALDFTVNNNIMLTSGDKMYDSDIVMVAARNFEVLTKGEQRYLSTGPNTNEGQDSIIIEGNEGPIRFTTPEDQQIYASGIARYISNTADLIITAMNDISLISASEIDFLSQFDVPITVTNGDIVLSANGGGGSVDIISDSAQDITTIVNGNIDITSKDSTYIYAKTGINMTTATRNIEFTQKGDHQNTHFHSGGTIELQAFQPDGIQFTAYDFVAMAGRDILFDATDSFTIGSASDANTATEPVIEFNAGDDTNAGMVFDVIGGMSWSTSLFDRIVFEADRASWTTGGDIVMTSNGAINFLNYGEFGGSSFTITTQALLNLFAGTNAQLESETAVIMNAHDDISFSATGKQSFDISRIFAKNNLVYNADTLSMSTGTLSGEVTNFNVDVQGDITIKNTFGDGGTYSFDSDSTLDVVSEGPIDFSSQLPTSITSTGPYSTIDFASAFNTQLTSGGALLVEGTSIDIDAPAGIEITAITGDLDFVASDYIGIRANGSMAITGEDVVSFQAGLNNNDNIPALINITSKGDLIMTSDDDFTLTVTGPEQDINIFSDVDISITNSNPSLFSDINIDSAGKYIQSSGNTFTAIANDQVYYESDNYDYNIMGDTSFTTLNGGDLDIQSIDDLSFNADDSVSFLSENGDSVFIIGGDFEWDQLNEEGDAGIVIDATTSLDIDIAGTIDFTALSKIEVDAETYFLIDVTGDMSVSSDGIGADITVVNEGSGGINVAATVFDISNANFRPNPVSIHALGVDGSIDITTVDGDISFTSGDDSTLFKAEHIEFLNPKTGGSVMTFESDSSLAIVSNGIDSSDILDISYGMLFETDDEITFTTTDDTYIRSNRGNNIFTASEDFTFEMNGDINFLSGNDLIISTGFTPQPNQQLPDRVGILFNSVTKSSFRSNHHDLVLEAEDVSWSVAQRLTIRSGVSTTMSAEDSIIFWDSDTVSFNAEHGSVASEGTFSIESLNTVVQFIAREDLIVRSFDEIIFDADDDMFIEADENVIFTTPQGYVDLHDFDTPLLIPLLDNEAGISGDGNIFGDKYRTVEENEYPSCEERSFGYDINANAFCYCQFNKWRCRHPDLSILPP